MNRKSKNERQLQRNTSQQPKNKSVDKKGPSSLADIMAQKDLRNQIEDFIEKEVEKRIDEQFKARVDEEVKRQMEVFKS